jgi:SulP family sulfate permease
VFEDKLPDVTPETRGSVVILRLRGRSDLGSTFMDVLDKYGRALKDQGNELMLVSADENMHEQLQVAGVADLVGEQNVFTSDEWVGQTLRTAYDQAVGWVDEHPNDEAAPADPTPSDFLPSDPEDEAPPS